MTRRRAAMLITAVAAVAAVAASWLRDSPFILPLAEVALPAVAEPTPATYPTYRPPPTARVMAALGRPLVPSLPRQLTMGGCCPGAWWSSDSRELRFLDRPDGAAGPAIFGVAIWPPGSPAVAVDAALDSQALTRYVVRPSGGESLVQDLETGERWGLPTGGHPVMLSPDGSRVVWWTAEGGEEHVRTLVSIHASAIDGSDVRALASLWRANVAAFLPDNRRVLVTGRPLRDRADYVLATLDTVTGELKQLARGSWLSDASLSRTGEWVAYMVSLNRERPNANGLWVVPSGGGETRRLDFVGAYRWRDGSRLVFVPLESGAVNHSVWQVDVATWEATRLFDPDAGPIRIADNDWSISPDGMSMAFLSEDDRNIWVVDMP